MSTTYVELLARLDDPVPDEFVEWLVPLHDAVSSEPGWPTQHYLDSVLAGTGHSPNVPRKGLRWMGENGLLHKHPVGPSAFHWFPAEGDCTRGCASPPVVDDNDDRIRSRVGSTAAWTTDWEAVVTLEEAELLQYDWAVTTFLQENRGLTLRGIVAASEAVADDDDGEGPYYVHTCLPRGLVVIRRVLGKLLVLGHVHIHHENGIVTWYSGNNCLPGYDASRHKRVHLAWEAGELAPCWHVGTDGSFDPQLRRKHIQVGLDALS